MFLPGDKQKDIDLLNKKNLDYDVSFLLRGFMKTSIQNGIREVAPQDLIEHLSEYKIIDVRKPEEFTGELGHIHGAKLFTLGPDLVNFLEKEDKKSSVVFVCRSGGRSGQATLYSQQMGFENTYNMQGGMIYWNELKLPVEKT